METAKADGSTLALRAILPGWANQQDGWCRAIVDNILKTRVQVSDQDVDHYLKLLLSEKRYSTLPEEIDVKINTLKIEIEALQSTSIQSEMRRSHERLSVVRHSKSAINKTSGSNPGARTVRS